MLRTERDRSEEKQGNDPGPRPFAEFQILRAEAEPLLGELPKTAVYT
jgi:hypothetical protein